MAGGGVRFADAVRADLSTVDEDVNYGTDSEASKKGLPSQLVFSSDGSDGQDFFGGLAHMRDMLGFKSVGLVNIRSEPKLKIEVLHSTDLLRSTIWFMLAMAFCVIYITVFVFMANLVWLDVDHLGNSVYELVYPPDPIVISQICVEAVVSTALLIATVHFVVMVLRTPRSKRTREMVHVIILGVSTVLIFLPLVEVTVLYYSFGAREVADGALVGILLTQSIMSSAFGVSGVYLFVWTVAISFRVKSGEHNFGWAYILKLFIMGLFLVVRLVSIIFIGVNLNWIPFASLFVALGKLVGRNLFRLSSQTVTVYLNTALELFLVVGIVLDLWKSQRFVNQLNYMQHRTTTIAFSQFKYYVVTTFSCAIIFAMIYIGLIPNDFIVLTAKLLGVMFFDPVYGRMSYVMVVPAFTFLQLYFMLPARAPTLFQTMTCRWKQEELDIITAMLQLGREVTGIFLFLMLKLFSYPLPHPVDINTEQTDSRFSYRVRENVGDPTFKTTSFVLESCIRMFNLGWLPYTYGTPDRRPLTPEAFDEFDYTITHYITDEETDTHCLVYSSPDRIVVAFKGTASSKNLQTDLMAGFVPLATLDKSNVQEEELPSVSPVKQGIRRTAMIHRGFTMAFLRVKENVFKAIHELLDQGDRPVFFTGHSLGAALATLCSYDCAKHIPSITGGCFVITFGSPRVGNRQFTAAYNQQVPNHWRVFHAKDPITKIPPPIYYDHVGKSALVTADGRLYIDPTFFETTWYHSSLGNLKCCGEISIKAHMRPAYAAALRKFKHNYVRSFLAVSSMDIWDITISIIKEVPTDDKHALYNSASAQSTSRNSASRKLPEEDEEAAETGGAMVVDESITILMT